MTIVDFKKGQFLSHHVRKSVQAALLESGKHAGRRNTEVRQSAASTTPTRGTQAPWILQPQGSLADTLGGRDEQSSLSSAPNGTSTELPGNKIVHVTSH